MQQRTPYGMQDETGTPYKEKASLQSLLKIIKERRLGGLSYITFCIHALLGAIILPLTFKLVIETLTGLAYTLSLKYTEPLAPIFERLLYLFQYAQWPLFIALVVAYWLRCNVKAYNYSFTQSVGVIIREQLAETDTPICPRCGKSMRLERLTEKIREQVGEHEEYYNEWVGYGADARLVTRKEIVPDYSDVEYHRQYAICQNPYCMYRDKRPTKRDVALYKFAEMPYKISDTINYSIRTHAKTNLAAGDIQQYPHGISLLGYTAIGTAMIMLCVFGDLTSISLLDTQFELSTFFARLAVSEGVALCCGIVFQIAVHVRYRKQTNDYIEIKNETDDGCTVVLPDGAEFYAKTDRYLQNLYDTYSEMQRMKESSSAEE